MLLIFLALIAVISTHSISQFSPLEFLQNAIVHSTAANNNCLAKLQSLIPPNMSDPLITDILMYSSHNINDLGNYKSCIATNITRYIFMKNVLTVDQPSMLSLALCLPLECTVEDLQPLRNYIYGFMKDMMAKNGINLDNGNFNYTVDSVIFLDSHEESIENTRFGIGSIITVSIILVLLIVVVIATIIDYNTKPSDGVLMSFSAIRNMKSLLSNANPVDTNLNVLNGVRVISILWVILGHTYGFVDSIMAPNISDMTYTMRYPWWFAMLTGATVSVDTFFALSGFFNALSAMRAFEKQENRNIKSVLKGIAMRYLRLTPLMMFMVILQSNVFSILFSGPIHNFWNAPLKICRDYFYLNLLYINNLFSSKYSCAAWTWYVACDMQFFIYSFIITIPFSIKKAYGYISIAATAVISIIIQAILISHYDLSSSYLRQGGNYMDIYYFKPYCRINTYLLGILFAWVYCSYKYKEKANIPSFQSFTNKINQSTAFRYFLYIVGIALTTACVFLQHLIDYYDVAVKIYQNVLFIVLSRPLFIIGLFFVVLPVMIGNGKPLLGFLGAPFMSPLAKLTYGVYLFHELLMYTEAYTMETYLFFSNVVSFMWAFHEYLFALLISIITTLLVEGPFMKLEKTAFGMKPVKKEEEYKELATKVEGTAK